MHVGLEHRHDVRVAQAADAARLAQPLADGDRVGRGVGMHQLDGDLALEPLVEAEPDRGRRAFAEHAAQLEAAERARQAFGDRG